MSEHFPKVGDSVRTVNMMFFVEAVHPDTGDTIETQFPQWHRLVVCGVNPEDNTVDVQLPDGYVATLPRTDVEL